MCIASVCCVRCAGCAGGQRVARRLPRSDGRQVPLPHLLWTQVSVLRLHCLNGSHFTMLHSLSGNLSLPKLSHHADKLLSFRSSRIKSHLFSLPYWQYVWCVRARLSSFWLCFDSLLLALQWSCCFWCFCLVAINMRFVLIGFSAIRFPQHLPEIFGVCCKSLPIIIICVVVSCILRVPSSANNHILYWWTFKAHRQVINKDAKQNRT